MRALHFSGGGEVVIAAVFAHGISQQRRNIVHASKALGRARQGTDFKQVEPPSCKMDAEGHLRVGKNCCRNFHLS